MDAISHELFRILASVPECAFPDGLSDAGEAYEAFLDAFAHFSREVKTSPICVSIVNLDTAVHVDDELDPADASAPGEPPSQARQTGGAITGSRGLPRDRDHPKQVLIQKNVRFMTP